MSEGVTYADLRFVKTPPKKGQEKDTWNQLDQIRIPPSVPHPLASLATDPSEGELTYENVQGPPCQEERTPPTTQGTKDPTQPTRYAILALLATCLFLLAAAIGLGVQYWQVSRQLQQAKEDGSVLARRVGAKEGSLAQTQAQLEEAKGQLHSTNGSLWGCWATGNGTQKELRDRGERLREASQNLTLSQQEKKRLQRDKEELEKEKERLEQTLKRTGSCQYVGCCPQGWNLFREKCLWISSDKKGWEQSEDACRKKTSQLLVLKSWRSEELWGATFIDKNDQYWIGLSVSWSTWKWADGTRFGRTEEIENPCDIGCYCVQMSNRALQWNKCSENRRYICEKIARPG